MFLHSHGALQDIKSLAFQRIPLAITSTYKGLFFEEKVPALKICPDYLVFKAPRPQICVTLQEQVWLHSQVLPQSVRAILRKDPPCPGEINLTNFNYSGFYWRDRLEQRIEPGSPIHAGLTVDSQSFPANLTNLSLHGAGLLVYLGENAAGSLPLKTAVELSFTVSEHNDFHILGTVASCRQMGYTILQIGLRLQPTSNQAAWLENYIANRKIEILRELDEKVAHSSNAQHSY